MANPLLTATNVSVARKMVISISVAGFTYLLTAIAKQPQIWSLTISIFIGGVFLVVQFLVELDQRLVKTNRAAELFRRAELADIDDDLLLDVVEQATLVQTSGRPLLRQLIQSELRFTAGFLRQLSQGQRAEYPGDEKDWLFALVENAMHSIKATSTIGPGGTGLVDEQFWDTPLAVNYLDLQHDAVARRKVPVRRIFIAYEPDVLQTPQLQQALQSNIDAKIEVRVLAKPPTSLTEPLDFVLFDDQISYEFTTGRVPGRQMSVVQRTDLVLRDRLVQRRRIQFDTWWDMAIPPQPPLSST